jgi:hypothetical protein
VQDLTSASSAVKPMMAAQREQDRNLGRAWVALSVTLGAHVADEALTDFLSVYNPLVLAARERFGWFPMPTFTFGIWLAGLILAGGIPDAPGPVCVPARARRADSRVSVCGVHAVERHRPSGGVGLFRTVDAGRLDVAVPDRCVDLVVLRRAAFRGTDASGCRDLTPHISRPWCAVGWIPAWGASRIEPAEVLRQG